MLVQRASGILCHVSSLPSSFGIGDLGPEASIFVSNLAASGQKYWQLLPLSPTNPALANSPYSSASAFAFNELLISPEGLVQDGLLLKQDLDLFVLPSSDSVDFEAVARKKQDMLDRVWERYCLAAPSGQVIPEGEFESFESAQALWLNDYALFVVLKARFAGTAWIDWPAEFRDRHPDALSVFQTENAGRIRKEKFKQFLFYRQWLRLRGECFRHGILLIGDIPIYVNYDSADVWRHPEFFMLDASRRPVVVAGVPPDYFSEEGQRWGNPIYNWPVLADNGFSWWIDRFRHNLALFDEVRIDHFRAFAQYWEIPSGEKTAKKGRWVDAPGKELFTALREHFPLLPVIAEDLGIITPDVDALKDQFGFPGMKVLMFAFHNDYLKSRDLPENYQTLSVAYTGTHDNNTLQGWYNHDLTPVERTNIRSYFGCDISADSINSVLIARLLFSSAGLVIIPLQDVLALGGEARMNNPALIPGNWKWRLVETGFDLGKFEYLRLLTIASGRCGEGTASRVGFFPEVLA